MDSPGPPATGSPSSRSLVSSHGMLGWSQAMHASRAPLSASGPGRGIEVVSGGDDLRLLPTLPGSSSTTVLTGSPGPRWSSRTAINAVRREGEIGVAQGRESGVIRRGSPSVSTSQTVPSGKWEEDDPCRHGRHRRRRHIRGPASATSKCDGRASRTPPLSVSHEHASSPFAGPAFQPVEAVAIRTDERETDPRFRDLLRRERRDPASIRLHDRRCRSWRGFPHRRAAVSAVIVNRRRPGFNRGQWSSSCSRHGGRPLPLGIRRPAVRRARCRRSVPRPPGQVRHIDVPLMLWAAWLGEGADPAALRAGDRAVGPWRNQGGAAGAGAAPPSPPVRHRAGRRGAGGVARVGETAGDRRGAPGTWHSGRYRPAQRASGPRFLSQGVFGLEPGSSLS